MIPLSETGHSQARRWAESLERPLRLIVVSPFLRARQTAAPFQNRFPNVPVEIWPIHEFTYLSPVKSAGTTALLNRRTGVRATPATMATIFLKQREIFFELATQPTDADK